MIENEIRMTVFILKRWQKRVSELAGSMGKQAYIHIAGYRHVQAGISDRG